MNKVKKPKIDSIQGDYRISINEKRPLSVEELFSFIIQFHKKNPELSKAILSAIKKESKFNRINCPFPFTCNAFPCDTLHCNADVCSNGYAYRMS